MSRTAYLHIGLPKTGTTYLQEVIWSNKDALAEAGVLVPGRRHRDHLLASVDARESPRLEKRAGRGARPWKKLVDEAAAWPGDVLVTHEFFCAASPDQVRRMVESLAGFDVRVLVTARSMNRLGISRWQEWVKNGGRRPIDAYPADDRYDPADDWGWASFDLVSVLERWGSVLPHDSIHVLVVDKGASPEQLWHRFAATIGVDPEGFPTPRGQVNRSLGVVEVELLRRINKKLDGFSSAMDRGTWIRGYLAEGDVLPAGGEPFRASDVKHRDLEERDRRAVELLTTAGYRVDGDPKLLLESVPETWRHPREVTDAELLDSATTTIANLLSDVRALTRERDRLKKRTGGGRVARVLRRARTKRS